MPPDRSLQSLLDDATEESPIRQAHAAFIRYPRLRALHERICECQQVSRLAQEPQCMVLEGAPGTGKTMLLLEYAKCYERYQMPEGMVIPVLYVETPSPVTVKGMAATLLYRLGDPLWHKGTQATMDVRLKHFIRECHVELIILDDFHHLIERHKPETLRTVANWLKVLIKETKCPVLVVGIDNTIDHILGDVDNRQLSRLFALRETLGPFPWNVRSPETIRSFHHFIRCAEGALDLPLHVMLPRLNFLYRLHRATQGVVANMMNLLRTAQVIAKKRQHQTIELGDIAEAYTERLAQHVKQTSNPFHDDYRMPRNTIEGKLRLE